MTAAATWSVDAALEDYAEITRSAMEPYLPAGEPAAHLYDLVRDYPHRDGKGVRPALLLATCQALGGTLRAGLAPAVSLEMMHNAFLVHDDIEDASALRRNRPTLHELHGVALAVNAGDALACLALRPLQADTVLGPRLSRIILGELIAVVRQTTEGQAMELGWHRDNVAGLDSADYLLMATKKTSWYTTVAPLRIGELAGSRGTARQEALTRFGLHLGSAFQIRDDLLNLAGAPGQGKDVHTDIRERKRTLMLIHLLRHAAEPDRSWLRGWLAVPGSCPHGADRVRLLMDRYGSIDFAHKYAAATTAAAHAAFDTAFDGIPASVHLDFIRDLIPYMTERRR